ncbi:hypothetical protein JTE90_017443 [Oedothorax gibbosus]|uniref:U1-type domain-containing protein n=1 Tax=Oedothorax gibbosus TaxID=931172 RepID=A0AAV6U1Y4_9ARAC|nr:hypothetical protein JTE90_017443 [Oedothorax gibbosus]
MSTNQPSNKKNINKQPFYVSFSVFIFATLCFRCLFSFLFLILKKEKMSNKKPESYSSLLSLDNEIVQKKCKPTAKNANSTNKSDANKNSRRSRSRSKSPKNKKAKTASKGEMQEPVNWDIPDRTFGDLYCTPCDSHMNSDQMWVAHIQGKRHLKNVKKGETVDGPKYEYIDEDPIMMDLLNKDTRPIVGLQHLVEIQRLEQRPTYQCFLCSANLPTPEQLLDHIAGAKHRLAYLKEHDPTRHDLIHKSNLKKGHVEPVLEECIASFESQFGRGKMVVKREKEDYKSPPRRYKSDYSNSRPSSSRSLDNFDDPIRHRGNSDRDRPYRMADPSRSDEFDRFGYGNRGPDSPPRHNIRDRRQFEEDKYSSPRYPPYEEDRYGRGMDARPDIPRPPYYEKYDGPRPLHIHKYDGPRHVDKYDGPRPLHVDKYDDPRPLHVDKYDGPRPLHVEKYDGPRPLHVEKYDGPRPLHVDKYEKSPPAANKYETLRPPIAAKMYERSMIEEEKMRQMRSLKEDNFGDLREILQQKKKPPLDPTPIVTAHSAVDTFGNIPEATLQIIEAMSTTVFLQVAYFKLNRIKIESDLEMRLLDKVSSKCTDMSMEIKTKQLPKNLQEQFKETIIAESLGIPAEYTKDYQQLLDMVGQVKAESKATAPEKNSQQPKYKLDPMYNAASYGAADTANISAPVASRSAHSWQQVETPQSSAYYTSPQIPGLTLTADNPTTPTQSSPFDPFAALSRHTKDLFGSAQNKNNSYRY